MTGTEFLADPKLQAVLAALPGARIVGGAVRDSLLGLPVQDIDLATPETPETVIAALTAAGIKSVPTGIAHGTVTAVIDHTGFEITTLRTDVETNGRHARVVYTDDWRGDAARRDFTFNAMSLAPDGALYDYFGGEMDLQAGRVRFVGDPARRIAEDYLRVLRYFRFQARYGRGDPDGTALAAIRAGVKGLAILSPERVWSELKKILAAPAPEAAIALMAETGVLHAVLPEAKLLPAGLPPQPLLRLAAMLDSDVDLDALAERLRLSGAERETLHLLSGPAPTPETIRRLLADLPNEILAGRAWLAGNPALVADILAAVRPVFPLRGRDLEGIAAGPEIGERLRATRQWWLDSDCTADRDACLAHARA